MSCIKLTPPSSPVTASIRVPGSKSYTNRALILASLCSEPVTIFNALDSTDTRAMTACLIALGIKIDPRENTIVVSGSVADIKDQEYELNVGASGTTMRFLTALACIVPGKKKITGDARMKQRPIHDLVETLKQAGAEIEYLRDQGCPPIKITSSSLKPGTITVPGDISSQFTSALLMIAPMVTGLKLASAGEKISKPYIDMTLDIMRAFGVNTVRQDYTLYTFEEGQKYTAKEYSVEGDLSSAGYFFAIAALTDSKITVEGINPQSVQADIKLLTVLEKMGSKIIKSPESITVEGKGIQPIDINMQDFPDQAQTLAVLCAFAEGVSQLSGVSSLRVKETERVNALEEELAKMGVRTESSEDVLTIYGGTAKGATIDSRGDHRMAMAFAIAGSKILGMEITEPSVVNKTFPEFWENLKALGIGEKVYA